LIVLAASPVTAPFSTCDLRQLSATSVVHATMSMTAAMPLSAAPSIDVTSNAMAPIVTQREPTAEARSGAAVLLFHGVFAAPPAVDRPPLVQRAPQDRSTRITVLRV